MAPKMAPLTTLSLEEKLELFKYQLECFVLSTQEWAERNVSEDVRNEAFEELKSFIIEWCDKINKIESQIASTNSK
jgi:hypothetical protein